MKSEKIFGVGLIGCGLIGNKRSLSLGTGGKLIACADVDLSRAQKIVGSSDARIYDDWRDLITSTDIDIVIVATLHNTLAEITLSAINAGKHVLVEKPAAINSNQIMALINAAKLSNIKVRVGFNHRYHQSLLKAKEIIDSGMLGELMFMRARYGHGGRIGYDREWRANPEISGGGELIDQGSHLIDLSRWFLGDIEEIDAFTHTYFWDMPVDDNAFLLLKNSSKQASFLHVSCTEWKNLFSMEIYGKLGKLELNGLGGSYGEENIIWYKMLPEMGPPIKNSWSFPEPDTSWKLELDDFYEDIRSDREPSSSLNDALKVLEIIETSYSQN
ncbi:Gfo/Idh/MocA family oxidoreductase [Pelagibacterales bacterium]|nr:Gfo/Idh/MocA family oxidoreductase [Pelagibacterales bacterium]